MQIEGETNPLKFSQVFHLAAHGGSFIITNGEPWLLANLAVHEQYVTSELPLLGPAALLYAGLCVACAGIQDSAV